MSKESNNAIEVKNLSKHFNLPTEHSTSLKQIIINWTKGIKGYKKQQVLKDISFNVEKGDFFGIVGRNGSGKSTLLKLISGIYAPDSGSIKINGSLVSFIELGVGFNPELTGRENVYLNGALLGFTVKEIDAMYDDIVDFAELRDFMDQKLKNYSSGMQVRLAFSCAIRAKSDILVLDEVLAVGDEAFQRKCFNYFAKLRKEKKTVILVTHSMDSVQQFCNKAMLVDKGSDLVVGTPRRIARLYRELNSNDDVVKSISGSNGLIANNYLKLETKYRLTQENVGIDVSVVPKVDLDDIAITLIIMRDNGEWVYRFASDEKDENKMSLTKGMRQSLHLDLQNIFCDGIFNIQVAVKSRDRSKEYIVADDIRSFEIINKGSFANNIFWKPKENYHYES